MRVVAATTFFGLVVSFFWSESRAAEKAAEDLVALDGAGKEIKLKNWKFTLGTRHLSWLVQPAKAPEKQEKQEKKDKKSAPPVPQGPECLDFREEKSTTYANGILTLIPLTSLRKIDYDHDKKTVSVALLQAGGKETVLTGSTKFVGINKFNIDGDAEAGPITLSGAVKFQDGFLRAGIKGYRFASAQPVPEPSGRLGTIVADDKEKTVHKVYDLVPLYKVGNAFRTVPALMFQKTFKVEIAKIAKMTHLPAKDKKFASHDFDITLEDGSKQGLTLLEKTILDDNQPAVLVGLVGKAAAGYKLFPAHTITDLTFDSGKEKKE